MQLMKRLLILLLAAIALPTTVNAETWWLLMRGRTNQGAGVVSWSMPTASEEECNTEKDKVIDRKNWITSATIKRLVIDAICLKGK